MYRCGFNERYGDKVQIYYIGDTIQSAFSSEYCGGPHVSHTGEIGHVTIKKQENMQQEKEQREREKNRLAIIEKIVSETKVEVPNILIESELNRMLYQMQSDISRMGLSYEDYLKHLNKTEEAIREEFKPDAEKRAKMELIMHEISKRENLAPAKELVASEVENLMKQYPGADSSRAEAYVTQILTNDSVFKFPEDQVRSPVPEQRHFARPEIDAMACQEELGDEQEGAEHRDDADERAEQQGLFGRLDVKEGHQHAEEDAPEQGGPCLVQQQAS
jgi:alanyl-tRNA synthetase